MSQTAWVWEDAQVIMYEMWVKKGFKSDAFPHQTIITKHSLHLKYKLMVWSFYKHQGFFGHLKLLEINASSIEFLSKSK